MLVKELMQRLESFDPQQEVFIAQPTHDYWRSVKVVSITGVDEVMVEHSAYHDGLVVAPEDVDESEGHEPPCPIELVIQ